MEIQWTHSYTLQYLYSSVIQLYLCSQQMGNNYFPQPLKALQKLSITVQIIIKEGNIFGTDTRYIATNICSGFITPPEQDSRMPSNTSSTSEVFHTIDYLVNIKIFISLKVQRSISTKTHVIHNKNNSQGSTSTFHLDRISQLNVDSANWRLGNQQRRVDAEWFPYQYVPLS